MIGSAVGVPIQKDQIAALHGGLRGLGVLSALPQQLQPCGTVGGSGQRLGRNPGILQAECGEQGAPCFIRLPVPRPIPAVGTARAILIHPVIAAAFAVAQLALRHGQQILRPAAAERRRQRLLPKLRRFHICGGIRITGRAVRVLLLPADQHRLAVARLCMRVRRTFLRIADRRGILLRGRLFLLRRRLLR